MATLAATPTTGVAGSDSNGGNLSYKDKQKLKRKERKKNKKSNKVAKLSEGQSPANGQIKNEDDGNAVVIEYTTENPLDSIERDDPLYGELSEILSKFGNASEGLDASDDPDAMDTTPADDKNAAAVGSAQDGNDDLEDDDEDTGKKLSKRQKRLARRLDIAVLKQLVKRPELVDACDPASTDPFLLVHLKSQRNSVPIPRHWQQRRKYLQVRGSSDFY
jgi:splicing factor 3B subunit 2